VPVAGGGYLRLFPVSLICRAIQHINARESQPAVVYFHPWEIDPNQPRIRAGLKSRFRHYLNLDGMETKVNYLLKNLSFTTIRNVLRLEREQNRESIYNFKTVADADSSIAAHY